MGLELAKAYVRIRGDSSQLQSDLGHAKDQVMSNLAAIAGSAAAFLTGFVFKASNILQTGMKDAGNLEETTIKMETMLGSAEEAQKTLARLTEFAVQTPFEMPQINAIATQMIQFGERGDDMMETLKILGDASGGTAAQFGILGMVYNQVRGVSKLLTQDFRQLSSRGIISLQDIADHFKVTTTEAQKMLSDGKVTFGEFRKILKGLTEEGGRYHNMMLKQSVSLNGLLSTQTDAWNILYRVISESLLPVMKTYRIFMIRVAEDMMEAVKATKGLASGALVGAAAFAKLSAVLLGTVAVLKVLRIGLLKAVFGAGIAAGIVVIGAALGAFVVHTVNWLKETDKVNGMLSTIKNQVKALGPLFYEILQNIRDNLLKIGIDISKWTEYVATFVSSAIGELDKILDWMSLLTTNWELTWKYMEIQAAIAITKIEAKLMGMLDGFKPFMKALGVGMDQAFDVKGGMDKLKDFWDTFMKSLNDRKPKTGPERLLVYLDMFKKLKQDSFDYKKTFTDMALAFGMGKGLPEKSPYEDMLKALKTQANDVFEQMQRARDKVREERKKAVAGEMEIIEKNDFPMQKFKKTGADLPTGRFGIAEFGDKLQDMLFPKEDEQGKLDAARNDLLKQSNKGQDKILEAIKKQGEGALKLT